MTQVGIVKVPTSGWATSRKGFTLNPHNPQPVWFSCPSHESSLGKPKEIAHLSR